MNKYTDCIPYLIHYGFLPCVCDKIVEHFESAEDMQGLIDFLLMIGDILGDEDVQRV